MKRLSAIKGVLAVSVIGVFILPVFIFTYIYPSFNKLMEKTTEEEAVLVATHAMNMSIANVVSLRESVSTAGFIKEMNQLQKDFGLSKVKIFVPDGEIVFSTAPEDKGHINKEHYFHDIVAKGKTYTKVVKKEALTLEGQKTSVDVVETYVPIMRDGRFYGAFEIYMDITSRKERLNRLLSQAHIAMFTTVYVLLGALIVSFLRANRNFKELNEAEEKILKQSAELKSANTELSVLYEVSTAISQTINMDELLSLVLKTVTRLAILKVEPTKGGIIIVDGNSMKIVSHLGHPQVFLDMHKDMTTNDCLCGIAARTGEIIISGNSDTDERHSFRYPDMNPHGHIIIPLKAIGKVIGVLYLYMPADVELDKNKIRLLYSIGEQVGMAIYNSNLYEKTKSLSLHDSLTGLANRRLMDIMLENKFAQSSRYGTPLSVIMADIDHFKEYNDTHGHHAGDVLLSKTAKTILSQTRASDLVARFGGEEFLIILPETNLGNAFGLAERIRKSVSEETGVTISLGVSSFKPEIKDIKTLIEKADQSLYRAKQTGRNRVGECE